MTRPNRPPGRPPGRQGFTIAEVLLALTVLAFAGVLVAELGTQVLADRTRTDARLDALDAAENVLEAARAEPWDRLTPAWAAGRKVPAAFAARARDAALTVTVEPEPNRPRVKRVTVAARWNHPDGKPARPVTLVTLLAARTPKGDTP